MKKLLAALLRVAAFLAPASASAHPLGNFTVNRFAAVELSGRDVFVHYVLDLAEIPTVPGGRPRACRRLRLGGRARARPRARRTPGATRAGRHKVSERPGAGGLPTLRFEAVYRVRDPGAPTSLVFNDTNSPSGIGWREIVVRATTGARLVASDVPAESTSDELRAYPQDLLARRSTSARRRRGSSSGPDRAVRRAWATRRTRALVGLLRVADRTRRRRCRRRPALPLDRRLLGRGARPQPRAREGDGGGVPRRHARHSEACASPRPIVTVTHTTGVFALGLVTLALSEFIVPEQLYPWLNLASALLVVGVGVSVLRARLRRRHAHDHHHHHDHGERSLRDLVAVGIWGGSFPADGSRRPARGHLAAPRRLRARPDPRVQCRARGRDDRRRAGGRRAARFMRRATFDGWIVRALPAASALLISGSGSPWRAARCRGSCDAGRWIAGLSDGTSLGLVVLVAVLLGLRHATDPTTSPQ